MTENETVEEHDCSEWNEQHHENSSRVPKSTIQTRSLSLEPTEIYQLHIILTRYYSAFRLRKIIYVTIIISTALAQYQNIAVVENDAMEQTLPDFLRNPFYRTPRIREALAYASWIGPGEQLVGISLIIFFPRVLILGLNVSAGV